MRPPQPPPLAGDFAPDERLAAAEHLAAGGHTPEGVPGVVNFG